MADGGKHWGHRGPTYKKHYLLRGEVEYIYNINFMLVGSPFLLLIKVFFFFKRNDEYAYSMGIISNKLTADGAHFYSLNWLNIPWCVLKMLLQRKSLTLIKVRLVKCPKWMCSVDGSLQSQGTAFANNSQFADFTNYILIIIATEVNWQYSID